MLWSTIFSISLVLGFPYPSFGALFETFEDLEGSEYDFVVIGGGTAGNTIANRLTENPKHRVLVLEAGGSNADVLLSMVPNFCTRTPGTALDWNYTAQAGAGALDREVGVPRGFGLGGSSSINCMMYTRGTKEDWDRYAKVTGDPGWSWDSIQPYVRKNEHFAPPADRHDPTGEFDPAVHGFEGINSVTLSGFRRQLDTRLTQASKSMGNDSDFRFVLDMNSGSHLGIGHGQSTVLNGTRSSSATSYLGPKFINHPNLHVLLHAHVMRILSKKEGGSLVFRGVEFSQDFGETVHTVRASKEVIVSAGSIGTPQILLNSGIGDTKALRLLGIPVLRHLPSVGRNLSEHAAVGIAWVVTANDTDSEAARNATLAAEQLKQWNETRSGPLVNAAGVQLGWVRLPPNSSIFERFQDPASGKNTAHVEFVFVNGVPSTEDPPPNLVAALPTLVSPISRGLVALNTSNPFDHPIIQLNLLNSEFDLFALREGIRGVRRFMESPSFDGFIVSGTVNVTTDQELDEYIKNNVLGAAHLTGTAMMSPRSADWGVVGPDLKVKGVEGVRIVDASVLPFVPAAHTQAPVYIVAERAADLVKASWRS